MKLGDLLNKLASKNGLQNEQPLIDLLSNADLSNKEIDDKFATALDSGLMSLDGAKNNPQLLNHFKPIILKAADDKFSILAEKYGVADEIAQEKSTYKKFDILESTIDRKINDLSERNGGKISIEEREKYNSQIKDLQTQLSSLTESNKKAIDDIEQKHKSEQLGMLIDFELSGKNWANKNIEKQINVLTAKTLLDAKLRESKAIVVNEDGTLKLKQSENPNLDYVDSGYKSVSFSDFADKVFADAKLIEVSGGKQDPQHVVIKGNQENVNATKFVEALESAKANIQLNN